MLVTYYPVAESANSQLSAWRARIVLQWIWYHFRPNEAKMDERAGDVRFFHVIRDGKSGKVECKPIDLHNAVDRDKLIRDIFELDGIR